MNVQQWPGSSDPGHYEGLVWPRRHDLMRIVVALNGFVFCLDAEFL
jgi:hypothetical protein